MSPARNRVFLSDVKPFTDEWRVRVKLLHSWKPTSKFGGETLECVLADETGQKIHASCRRNLMYRIQRELPLGEWREIENFKISAAGGQYRPTTFPYKMTMLADTTVTRSDYHNDNHFLTLAKYEEIGNGTLKPYFLIDIMGLVVNLGEIVTVQVKGEDRKRVHFRLRNTSGDEVACCLWGKYAEQIESHIEESPCDTIICLIRFAKISSFNGDIQITNSFDSSVLLLNPSMDEAVDFKEKILKADLPLALLAKDDDKKILKQSSFDWNDVNIKCISEILLALEDDTCKIICTIEGIDKDWGWFYFGCNRHNRRATKVGRNEKRIQNQKPLFYCDICHANVSNVSPKYKLHVFVKDDTGTCELMLLDSVARTIIDAKAVELWDGSYDEIEDPDVLPMPIESLVGKSFCFGIKVSSENYNNGSSTFKVSEVWSGDYIQRVESLSEPVSLPETNSSTLSTGEVCLLENNNQSSSEDASTPSAKRKEGDGDHKDMSSTSKKLCSKSIKLKKPSK